MKIHGTASGSVGVRRSLPELLNAYSYSSCSEGADDNAKIIMELYVPKGGVVNWPGGAKLPGVGAYFLSDLTLSDAFAMAGVTWSG
jgi:hypothetical protein